MILYRVDDRLIHGQVTYSWVKGRQLEAIYIVDDKIRTNEFEKMSVENLGSLSMDGKKVEVLSEKEASERMEKIEKTGENVLVLFKNPITMVRVIKNGGFKPDVVNVAGVGRDRTREHAKLISRSLNTAVYLTDKEIAALKELQSMGIRLYQQVLVESGQKEIKL